MKVLVINQPFVKHFCRTQRWAARTRGRVLRPPEWLGYATAVLKQDGQDAKLFDFPALDWEKDRLAPLIRRSQPDAVVMDSTTPSIFSDIDCARIVKDEAPDCKVYMVGPHATSEPEDTLTRANGYVDAIALGEYDYTIRDLCRGYQNLAEVPGVAYLESGKLARSAARPLIKEVDQIPFPAWEDINIWDYFDGGKLYPYLSVISGRGCPYGCTYCVWPQVMHGRGYRLRSAENVVDEIEHGLRLFPGLRWGEFFFEDDTFGAHRKRAAEVCEEILRRDLKINWSVNSRVDTYKDAELLKLMKRAGCWKLLVGFESGDPDTLKRVDKGATVDDGRKLMEVAKEAKMDVHGCFVVGFPGETEAAMQRTIDFALSLGLHTVQFTAAVPYPGTKLYDECEREGLLAAESWSDWLTNGEQTGVIDLPGLPKHVIERYVDQGLRRFYFRPSYMLRFFAKTRSASDLYRKVRGFYNYASYMASDQLDSIKGALAARTGAN